MSDLRCFARRHAKLVTESMNSSAKSSKTYRIFFHNVRIFLQHRKPKMTSSTSGSSRSSGSICATSSCIFRFVVIRDVPSISKIDGDDPIAV